MNSQIIRQKGNWIWFIQRETMKNELWLQPLRKIFHPIEKILKTHRNTWWRERNKKIREMNRLMEINEYLARCRVGKDKISKMSQNLLIFGRRSMRKEGFSVQIASATAVRKIGQREEEVRAVRRAWDSENAGMRTYIWLVPGRSHLFLPASTPLISPSRVSRAKHQIGIDRQASTARRAETKKDGEERRRQGADMHRGVDMQERMKHLLRGTE